MKVGYWPMTPEVTVPDDTKVKAETDGDTVHRKQR